MCNKSFCNKIRDWILRMHAGYGYGIHSPFAFALITYIIKERSPYYVYQQLALIKKELVKKKKLLPEDSFSDPIFNPQKVDELLFRLVNFKQPKEIIEVGTRGGLTTLYLAFANTTIPCITLDTVSCYNELALYAMTKAISRITFIKGEIGQNLEKLLSNRPIGDFIVFNPGSITEENWEICIKKAGDHSLYIIVGINSSEDSRKQWKKIVASSRTVLTFDLGETGLVFFDTSKTKQHYILTL